MTSSCRTRLLPLSTAITWAKGTALGLPLVPEVKISIERVGGDDLAVRNQRGRGADRVEVGLRRHVDDRDA